MAQAAPKPLSMPTTVTPEAQAASMASSAVTPLEGGAVAGAGGHGHDRGRGEAADHAGQRPLHAGDHHHGVGRRPARRPRPAAGGDRPRRSRPAGSGRSRVPASTGHAFVWPRGDRPCRRSPRPRGPVAGAAGRKPRCSVEPGLRHLAGPVAEGLGGRRVALTWSSVARVRRTGPGAAPSSSPTMAAHCSGVLPGP